MHGGVRLRIAALAFTITTAGAGCGFADDVGSAAKELRALLGRRLGRAKLVTTREDSVVSVELSTLHVTEIAEWGPGSKFWGLSTPRWSPDGSRIICSYRGQAFVLAADGSERHRILEGTRLHSPFWWKDPQTGEDCVVYKDADAKAWYGKDGNPGATYLWRASTGSARKIADFPCDGTMSVDGTHLAEAYGGCLIVNIPERRYHVVYGGRQACNSSMSPDNTYRIMHLYLPHTRFGIRDKNDRELWNIPCPPGTQEWQVPNWSTDPGFCTATVKVKQGDYKLAVIRIHDSKVVVLDRMGGRWGRSHLWLPPQDNRDLGQAASRRAPEAAPGASSGAR